MIVSPRPSAAKAARERGRQRSLGRTNPWGCARAQPARHFIGCELYQAGIATLLYHLKPADRNIAIDHGDARDLLTALPKGSVNRLLLPHPDPWPKARHHKRRILNKEFLDEERRVLEPAGEFWFVTDWPDYAEAGLEVLRSHEGFNVLQTPAPAWCAQTKYQQKAAKAGRMAVFIVGQPIKH